MFRYHQKSNFAYRQWLKEQGVTEERAESIKDPQQIPVINKDFFLNNFNAREQALQATSCPLEKLVNVYETSNGSSAPYSQKDIETFLDCWENMLAYHGIKNKILINALPLGPWSGGRHNDLVRTVLKISSPQFFSEEQHVNNLKKWNPEALITFPALLSKLYQYMLEKGHDPQREFSNLEKVFIAGEMSSRGFRDKLGSFLGAEVIDAYACSELAILAVENKEKTGLIAYPDRFRIDIVDPHTNQPIAEGQGKILITDLKAEAKPIIRYDLGDLA
ncbi:MAG: AMP-binding protein, partial [Candidatus Woesearchaeota archaeon]